MNQAEDRITGLRDKVEDVDQKSKAYGKDLNNTGTCMKWGMSQKDQTFEI